MCVFSVVRTAPKQTRSGLHTAFLHALVFSFLDLVFVSPKSPSLQLKRQSLCLPTTRSNLGGREGYKPGLSCLSLFRRLILPTPLLIPHRVSWPSNSLATLSLVCQTCSTSRAQLRPTGFNATLVTNLSVPPERRVSLPSHGSSIHTSFTANDPQHVHTPTSSRQRLQCHQFPTPDGGYGSC